MKAGLLRIVGYSVVILIPILTAALLHRTPEGVTYQAGRHFALLGIMILAFQAILAARIKWIEKPFGFDILIRFHKHMAIFAAALLLLHPLLLAAGGAGWRLIIGLNLPWYIWLGKAALILLLANAALSHYQLALKMKFEAWRMVHDILGPIIIVSAFVHSWFVGQDLETAALKALWILMALLAVLVFGYHRFARPYRLKRRPWQVVEVREEAKDVRSVKLVPPEGRKVYDYLPGQFHFITFYRERNLPVEEHHWTISSSPTEKGCVTSTIKALGDFTATMSETRVGDKAAVHGAFGRFSYALHPEERDLVFLAGGIGITPLMSMLRHMRDRRDTRSVLLLYANKKEQRIVFRDELCQIEAGKFPRLKVVHVLSDPQAGWTGETGRVNPEKIQRFCGKDLGGKTFYVCGPPGMLKAIIGGLKDLDVPDRRIRVEIFSFLD